MKKMIIRLNKNDVFFKYIKNQCIMNYYNVNYSNIFYKICMKFQLSYISLFLGEWKRNIRDCDEIILFDNGFQQYIPKYIKKKNKDTKVILWLWNSINDTNRNFLKNKYIDEFWTFDEKDALKYSLNYNTQFYTNEIKLDDSKERKNDIIFLGKNKNREYILSEFEKKTEKYNLNNNFIIINNENEFIKYEDYLKMIENSKAILEIMTPGQNGLTLRSMEALFFKKKLITNNLDIVDYDFYDSNNIFILGKDNIENIKTFIEKTYKEVNQQIINYYDYKSWINRFDI